MKSSSPKIETLIEDIYHLLDEDTDHECSEENLNVAAEQFKDLLRRRLSKQDRKGTLRFSNLGRPDCQVWYKVKHPEAAEKLSPQVQMKFMYGDLLEAMLLFLAKEAGHEVTDEQREVSCDGVKGHIDAIIDGVVVDVKSASPYAFKKFSEGRLEEDDPFGYIAQLSGYCNVLDKTRGGFLAINKESGGIVYSPLEPSTISQNPPGVAIARQREALNADTVPSRFNPIPDGKSGNLKLDTLCSYCDVKKDCWKHANNGLGLRTFLYSRGPVFLTKILREPDVYEVA